MTLLKNVHQQQTVSTYKSRLMEKLECKSLMDLYIFAQRN